MNQRKVALLAGVAVSAFLVFFPTRALVSEKLRITRLEQRLDALKIENRKLESEVKRLESPAELELLARERLGLVRPGERAYLLVPQPTPEPLPAPERDSWGVRLWSKVVAVLKGAR